MSRRISFGSNMVGFRPTLAVLFYVIASAGGNHDAVGQPFTWTGNAPTDPPFSILNNNNWTNIFNWQDAQAPVNDGTAQVIILDTDRDNSEVNTPFSIASLTFQAADNLSVNEDPLTLNDITNDGSGTATFNNSVGVSGSGAIWRADSGPMTFNGAITGTNSITLQAPHTITFDGSAANTISGAVTVTEGTLVLSKSSFNGAIANSLQIANATVRWDADDQVSDSLFSQVGVQSGGVANLNGHDETFGQLALINSQVQSTSGKVAVAGQLGLQGSAEVDLGAGELELQSSVVRSGSSSATSRIEANLITLNRVQSIFFVSDSPGAVELEIAADIEGAFATTFLEKSGDGALRLTGAATYQAGTTISGGVLIVDNTTGSGTGPGTVTVATGATLTGDGAIGGTVAMQNGATITPSASTGFPIGSLTIGALSMNTTSVFDVQFNHALPLVTRRDVLTVTGSASLNGILALENLNSIVLPDASSFIILSSSLLTGSFANVANGARLRTLDHSGSFIVNYGPITNQVLLSNFLPSIPGDFDADRDADARDFLTWQRSFGAQAVPPGSGADEDRDGLVDGDDLAIWRAHFGEVGSSSAAQNTVPEPATWILLCAAGCSLRGIRSLARRRNA